MELRRHPRLLDAPEAQAAVRVDASQESKFIIAQKPEVMALIAATSSARLAASAAGSGCAGHVQQFGSESLLPNRVEVKG